MKQLMVTVAAFILSAGTALAQDATANTSSSSYNLANQTSASAALAAGGSVIYNEAQLPTAMTTTINNTERGTRTILGSGGAQAPAVFSGTHSCALGVSGGIAGVVGDITGLSGGYSYTDKECEVRQEAMVLAGMGLQDVALMHMATHDDEVRCTLYTQKRIQLQPGASTGCKGKGATKTVPGPVATTSTRNVTPGVPPAPQPKVAYAKCEIANNVVTVRRKPGADKALAKAQCLASLGY